MNIIIAILIGIFCGGIMGFGIAILMAAAARDDDQAAADADAQAEIALLRRQNARLQDQLATLVVTLSATRDREELLAELAREMNQ